MTSSPRLRGSAIPAWDGRVEHSVQGSLGGREVVVAVDTHTVEDGGAGRRARPASRRVAGRRRDVERECTPPECSDADTRAALRRATRGKYTALLTNYLQRGPLPSSASAHLAHASLLCGGVGLMSKTCRNARGLRHASSRKAARRSGCAPARLTRRPLPLPSRRTRVCADAHDVVIATLSPPGARMHQIRPIRAAIEALWRPSPEKSAGRRRRR